MAKIRISEFSAKNIFFPQTKRNNKTFTDLLKKVVGEKTVFFLSIEYRTNILASG